MDPERRRQIEDLHHAALERDPGLRAKFLSEACRNDEELRREVESMLAQDGVLTPGTQIGAYRIEATLGQGGMGVVYRALDTKLNRPVAVKVLSSEIADATARRRFQREAQMASSLNHPHILTVHDAGEWGGRQYLVTEFVDGGTLKDWAREEKRNWRQVVEILVGVADGLAAAHQAGILHRDIKPANILVAKNGYAKLADFGLAKIEEHPSPDSVTRTQVSKQGMVVGTIPYMSPEQASGQPTDPRSDIFSFGVVLYEMLAGERPFLGATDLAVLQSIIHGSAEPLGGELPSGLRMIVEKSLEKDPSERYQSMREMVVDLRRLTRQSGETATAAPRQTHGWKKGALAAVILLALSIGGAIILSRSRQPAGPARVEYTQLTNFTDSATSPALSPDGRMLTFIRGTETFAGRGQVYVKFLPDGEPVQLTHDGTNKMSPVFLPAGDRIAYGVTGGMGNQMGWATWTVPVFGGKPSLLLSNTSALTWISGATPPRIVFSEWGEGAHMKIVTSAENRSEARTVYAPANPDAMAHRSYPSPDGKNLLVVEMEGGWRPCRLTPFDGGTTGKLVGPSPSQCTSAAWSPDGKWMYFSANTGNGYHIWRQRFPDGAPEQITFGATEEEGISFAPDGRSFVTSVGSRQTTMWVHDERGERQITSQGYASLPSFSADRKKLYYLLRSRANRRFVSGELWAADLETGQRERLLPGFLMEHYSVSRDGSRVVFAAIDETGHSPVWLATLDGRAAPRRLSTIDATRTFFGANGDVYFLGVESETKKFVYRVSEDGSGLQKALPDPVAYFYDVSPDAKLLAVLAGIEGVHTVPINGGRPTRVCTICGAAGGENRAITPPAMSWSADGKFLYLNIRAKFQIYAVPLQPGQNLPPLPESGISSLEEAAALPGKLVIPEERAYPGATPSVYAFPRVTTQRNIYRIPVP